MKNFYLKSFTIPFYRAFLGFFVLATVFLGVFMEVRQHVLIAERLLQSQLGFMLLLLAFGVYAFFQIRFQLTLLTEPGYRVFHLLAFFHPLKFCFILAPSWVANHLLLVIYSLFFTYIGIVNHSWSQPIILWVVLFALFTVQLLLIYKRLQHPYPDRIAHPRKLIGRLVFGLWFAAHLKENRPVLFLACKILSLTLLNAFLFSFHAGGYDIRWVQFGFLAASFINYPIWLEKEVFEKEKLPTLLNMPRIWPIKLRHHGLSMLLIILPELIFLIFHFRTLSGYLQLVELVFLWFSLQLGIYVQLVLTAKSPNTIRYGLGLFFLFFLSILFSVPPLFLAFICIAAFVITIQSPYRI